jgi:hypothetical protein
MSKLHEISKILSLSIESFCKTNEPLGTSGVFFFAALLHILLCSLLRMQKLSANTERQKTRRQLKSDPTDQLLIIASYNGGSKLKWRESGNTSTSSTASTSSRRQPDYLTKLSKLMLPKTAGSSSTHETL